MVVLSFYYTCYVDPHSRSSGLAASIFTLSRLTSLKLSFITLYQNDGRCSEILYHSLIQRETYTEFPLLHILDVLYLYAGSFTEMCIQLN